MFLSVNEVTKVLHELNNNWQYIDIQKKKKKTLSVVKPCCWNYIKLFSICIALYL